MMGANRSLLTLRLDNNPYIAGEGVMELCLGLRTNKTLKVGGAGGGGGGGVAPDPSLHRACTTVVHRGRWRLVHHRVFCAMACPKCSSLQKLTMSYCSVGPEGAAALGEVLSNPECALGHLDLMVSLSRRPILCVGAVALRRACRGAGPCRTVSLCARWYGMPGQPGPT
jgi:hypothetical protein